MKFLFKTPPILNSYLVDEKQEELEDTKGAIKIRISKNRQHNGKKKKQLLNDRRL